MKADEYNRREAEAKRLTWVQITELVRYWQRSHALYVDGKAGPLTRRSINELLPITAFKDSIAAKLQPIPEYVVVDGWIEGPNVVHVPMHASWRYSSLNTINSEPTAIVAHYTATRHGTALSMANRRRVKREDDDRAASWHLSIEGDGTVVQMAPLTVGCWHAKRANRYSVGIELVGYGQAFPATQAAAAAGVWRAICGEYMITRARAMLQHSEIDPDRRRDPGPLWMKDYAPYVLGHAFD